MRLWKPEIFQGAVNKKQYFEGWYFKLVDKEEKHSFAVIPGISLSPSYSHSFIQFFSGHTGSAEYHTYTKNDFSFSKNEFIASIADSSFSLNHLKLSITSPSQSVKADLRFKNIKSWPVSPFSPGVMGPFRFATYTGAKISHLSVTETHITIHIEDRKLLLKINADREQGADLPAPQLGAMTSKVNESLRSKIAVELIDIKRKTVIFSGTGRNAGLEFVGQTSELF
jgi:hypothetical protein